MIIDKSLKVKNYKCFGEEAQGFEKIYPINIIIGKNNSGKSSLIDLVKYATGENLELIKSNRNSIRTKVIFPHEIIDNAQTKALSGTPVITNLVRGIKFDIEIEFKNENESRNILNPSKEITDIIKGPINSIVAQTAMPLRGKVFKCITAERDIVLEGGRSDFKLTSDGNGATSLIQLIYTNVKYDTRLIKGTLLKELNCILNPEIKFIDINLQINDLTLWEIYLDDGKNGFIPLSKMGSGIKTVILVLLNLIIVPTTENQDKSSYVFAFEELENNLHPALLRRLLSYILDYSRQHKCYFFITTHSNIVIDIFGNSENAQIIHISNRGDQSICTTVNSHLHNKNILKDLDVRASDLLQSNGIIWVEGPSDRVYINKWLGIQNPLFLEGLHYSILFYGGRLLSNLTFDYKWLEEEFIPLLKINHNAFVIIDRDGKSNDSELNRTKLRIQAEIGEKNCWITQGREIENYLSNKTLTKWIKSKYDKEILIENDLNTKLEKTISNVFDGVSYDKNKKSYSLEITEHISRSDLFELDLDEKLLHLTNAIKKWNSIDQAM